VNLIPGFYSAAEGAVLLDGTNVSEFDPESLRSQIGIVPQKAQLFQGTIRENLLWGNENASDADLWTALETAQAREVVKDKPGELDAKVAQGGTNLSGGQRQRLTIARALVRKPKILILDDSASALDYATDASLRMAIRSMPHSPTTFIVSQRAASVRYADLILVLDDGALVGAGTHDELLANCPVYQEIYYSQFPKEVR
jgi:ABC-type multidrug transport system fused ATPase/permease subunit